MAIDESGVVHRSSSLTQRETSYAFQGSGRLSEVVAPSIYPLWPHFNIFARRLPLEEQPTCETWVLMAADLLVHDNRHAEAYELFERWRAKAPSDPLAVRHQVRFLLRFPTRWVLSRSLR